MARRHTIRTIIAAFAVLMTVGALVSCNARKKNTAAARQYTAFITRYNIYYNGDRHYVETLEEMEKAYEDDYTDIIYVHPAEAKQNPKAPQPSGDFNRSIEKAQKAIQLRSITKKPPKSSGKRNDPEYKKWMRREEYNPFLHNAWLMMGRGQYMNGDFSGAASTFFYISKHFWWLPKTVTEAQLWQARSYLAMDWLYEAETIIVRIKPDEITDGKVTGLYNLDLAELNIRRHNYAEAVEPLRLAIKHSSGAQKTRLWFLLGQVLSRLDRREEAYKAYGKAGGASNATYRTRFNARIKQSEVYTGSNIEPEVKALRRMTRYDRNKEYLDQIYYAIGNLYLSRGDTVRAAANYVLAAEKSTRNGIDKALAQVKLGGLYYKQHKYELAQPCYSEAVPQLPDNFPGLDTIKRRSDVLDELAVYSQNVNLQDSLLRLAAMSEDDRNAVLDRIIAELVKKEKEEAEAARREEFKAKQESGNDPYMGQSSAPQTYTLNTDDSWYFYNTATRNAGKTEFQRRWGARKLEDNWRRRNKTSFAMSDFDSSSASDEDGEETSSENIVDTISPEDKEKQEKAENPHYREYYLKQIPFSDADKAVAHEVIQEGLFNMGVILKDKLNDFDAAMEEFDRLLVDYPDNVYRLETYYNIYLMFVRSGNDSMAERYRQMIVNGFRDSKYGEALRNPDYINNLRQMDAVQEKIYEDTYDAYMANNNEAVHSGYQRMADEFPMSKLMPKFMFLDALAYVTENNPEQFNATLRTMLERYPDTDVAPIASAWLKGMAAGRKLHTGGGSNMRGMLWDISLTNDTTAGEKAAINFTLNESDPQVLVMVFPTDAVSSNRLLFEIARHNFRSFVVKDFDLEQMNFGRLGMIVIGPFENLNELNHYRRVMAASTEFRLPDGVRPVPISRSNFDALLQSGGTLDDYFRFLQEQNYQDAQSGLLPYHEIQTLPEAEAEASEAAAEASATTSEPTSAENTEEATPSENTESTERSETMPIPSENAENSGKSETEKPDAEPAPTATPTPTPAAQPKPEAKTETKPEAKPEPATKPSPKPKIETKPSAKVKPETKSAAKPTEKPKPAPKPKPRPTYDPGSEGDEDDPLLN